MIRKQVPSNPDNWLYQKQGEDTCVFSKFVFLGVDAPEWQECDNAFKEEWEAAHPEPIQEDIQEADVV